MPAKKQGESFVLKHRLAGAAVLIGFAVVVLPLLLGGPGDDGGGEDQAASPGESETRVFRSNITPIGGETPDSRTGDGGDLERSVGELLESAAPPPGDVEPAGEAPADNAGTDGDGQQAAEPGQPDDATGDGSRAATGDAEDGASDSAASGDSDVPREVERGWIVQVGTFTKAANVEKLVAELEEIGFGPSTTDVSTSSGNATRVWVGPFETRVEAARVKTRLTQRTGSEGLIVAYP